MKGGNCWSSLDRASEQYDRRSFVEGRIEWGKAVWRAENESRVISNYSARRLVGTSQLLNRQGSTNRLEPDLCSYYLGHILFSVHNWCRLTLWLLLAGIVPVTHIYILHTCRDIDRDDDGKIIVKIAIALLHVHGFCSRRLFVSFVHWNGQTTNLISFLLIYLCHLFILPVAGNRKIANGFKSITINLWILREI